MLSRLVRTAAGAGGQALEYTFTSDSLHADLLTLAVASGWDATKSGTFTAYVGDGTNPVGLYSNSGSSSQYGLSLGSGWAAETIINLIVRNNGHIVGTAGTAGGGGGGGSGGSGGGGGSGGAGGAGGCGQNLWQPNTPCSGSGGASGSGGSGGASGSSGNSGGSGGSGTHALNID